MTAELLYTSAAKGLKAGSRGFCTVVSSSGMPSNLASKLESLSGYRQMFLPSDPNASKNPIAFSHLTFNLGGQPTSVLSRVAAYGADYSGRTNKLAHHVVPSVTEKVAAGPAWLLMQPGVMRTEWDGNCQTTPAGPTLPSGNLTPGMCNAWQRLAGDAGWGGVVADSFRQVRGKPMFVIYSLDHQRDLLQLLTEATALLPPEQRWQATFSTYAAQLPPDVNCQVRFVVEGSQEAQMARARGTVIHLGADNGAVPPSDLVDIARGKSPAPTFSTPSQPAAPVAPATPAPGVAIPSIDAALSQGAASQGSGPAVPITGSASGTQTPSLPNIPNPSQANVYDDFKVSPARPMPGVPTQQVYSGTGYYEGEIDDDLPRSSNRVLFALTGLSIAALLLVVVGAAAWSFRDEIGGQFADNTDVQPDVLQDVTDPIEPSSTGEKVGQDQAEGNAGPLDRADESKDSTTGPSDEASTNQSNASGDSGKIDNSEQSPDMDGQKDAEKPEKDVKPPPKPKITIEPTKNPVAKKITLSNLHLDQDYTLTINGEVRKCEYTSGGVQGPKESKNDTIRVSIPRNETGQDARQDTLVIEIYGSQKVNLSNRLLSVQLQRTGDDKEKISASAAFPITDLLPEIQGLFNKASGLSGGQISESTIAEVDISRLRGWSDQLSVKLALARGDDPLGTPKEYEEITEHCFLSQKHALDVSVDSADGKVIAKLKNLTQRLALARSMSVKLSLKIEQEGKVIFATNDVSVALANESANIKFFTDLNIKQKEPNKKRLPIEGGIGGVHVVGGKSSWVLLGTDRYPAIKLNDGVVTSQTVFDFFSIKEIGVSQGQLGSEKTYTATFRDFQGSAAGRPNVDADTQWHTIHVDRLDDPSNVRNPFFLAFHRGTSTVITEPQTNANCGFKYEVNKNRLKSLFGEERDYTTEFAKLVIINKDEKLLKEFEKDVRLRRENRILSWLVPITLGKAKVSNKFEIDALALLKPILRPKKDVFKSLGAVKVEDEDASDFFDTLQVDWKNNRGELIAMRDDSSDSDSGDHNLRVFQNADNKLRITIKNRLDLKPAIVEITIQPAVQNGEVESLVDLLSGVLVPPDVTSCVDGMLNEYNYQNEDKKLWRQPQIIAAKQLKARLLQAPATDFNINSQVGQGIKNQRVAAAELEIQRLESNPFVRGEIVQMRTAFKKSWFPQVVPGILGGEFDSWLEETKKLTIEVANEKDNPDEKRAELYVQLGRYPQQVKNLNPESVDIKGVPNGPLRRFASSCKLQFEPIVHGADYRKYLEERARQTLKDINVLEGTLVLGSSGRPFDKSIQVRAQEISVY